MAKKKFDKLKAIERVARDVAQSIWGGAQTVLNSRYGDLWDQDRYAFAEVKGAGDSQGAIIRKSQLDFHRENLSGYECEYVFVYYKNKGLHRGKRRSLTFLAGTTETRLQNFLVGRIYEIYIVDVSVVSAIYEACREKGERSWRMKEGLRTGLKLRACRLLPYVRDVQRLVEIYLNPPEYVVSQQSESVRFGDREIPVTVFRIIKKGANV